MFLRDMNLAGMPYLSAVEDSNYMPMEASALLRNQLKKFAAGELKSMGTVQREIFERTRAPAAAGAGRVQDTFTTLLATLQDDICIMTRGCATWLTMRRGERSHLHVVPRPLTV